MNAAPDIRADDPRAAAFPRCSGVQNKPCTRLLKRAGFRPVGYAAQSCGHHCPHALVAAAEETA